MTAPTVVAFDPDDLLVMSAHLAGSIVQSADMTFLPKEKRFALALDRPVAGNPSERRMTALHFERVTRAMTARMPLPTDETTLKLIGIGFEPVDVPSGNVVLLFENDAAIRLSVECLEAAMADLPQTDSKE